MTTPLDVDRIVREVMRRLARAVEPSESALNEGSAVTQLRVEDRVVTLNCLAGRLGEIRQLMVPRNAVITPAVQDVLREQGIDLVRQDVLQGARSQNGSVLIANLEPSFHTAGLIQVVKQLGMASELLTAGSLPDAVSQLVRAGSSSNASILATSQPAAATCLANRCCDVRAAWAIDVPSVVQAVTTIAANLLVLDPTRNNRYECKNIVRAFLATPRQTHTDLKTAL